ncbi:hypothetical protein NPIL_497971 [Nephila pilipes]|uniref:Uncharacterized protein n=1 Tax=Nephila pilipes TaxID=299642 RepID=A0A8X6P3T6_NEPPI|nr:hypothetical protein NPIL_497971 [Nephila pilipes]
MNRSLGHHFDPLSGSAFRIHRFAMDRVYSASSSSFRLPPSQGAFLSSSLGHHFDPLSGSAPRILRFLFLFLPTGTSLSSLRPFGLFSRRLFRPTLIDSP